MMNDHLSKISEIEAEHVLKAAPTRWDRQIAVDLIAEMETYLGQVNTIPEMRRVLAVAGYNGLRQRIENAVRAKSGPDALRAMAFAMRSYALGSPGLAAASFRSADRDSPEWREGGKDLARTIFSVFAECGIEGEHAQHAVRILRSLVRGFILNEMASSNSEPLEFQHSYVLAVNMFIHGLPALEEAA
jgi:hypothetical protein